MSKSKYEKSTLSALVDSDSDENGFMDSEMTPNSAAENMLASKKGRGRPKAAAAKVTKVKTSTRRTSGRITAAKKGKRAPLSDKTNEQNATSDTEEVEEFEDTVMDNGPSEDELDATAVTLKQSKSRVTKSKPANKATKVVKGEHSKFTINNDTPEARRIGSRSTASKKTAKRQVPEVIQETQESLMEVEDYGDEEIEEPTIKPRARHVPVARATSQTRQTSVPRRRAGSASDTERNDPAIRRKLGDLTKKFDNLDLKYRNVREIGIKEAEHNFERLKKQSEESTKGKLLMNKQEARNH
jgi:hypothetical protein